MANLDLDLVLSHACPEEIDPVFPEEKTFRISTHCHDFVIKARLIEEMDGPTGKIMYEILDFKIELN